MTWTPATKNSASFSSPSKSSAPSWTPGSKASSSPSNTPKNTASWTDPAKVLLDSSLLELENGSYLLLETSDKVLLDQSIVWTAINKS